MSERLTTSSSKPPRWIHWIPPLILAVSALAALAAPLPRWEISSIPETGPYSRLATAAATHLGPNHAFWLHLPFVLLLVGCAGALVARMLPPKTPTPSRVLARSLGMASTVMLQISWLQAGLSPTPILPASALMLAGWLLFLRAEELDKSHLLGFSGLLNGTAAALSLFTAPGILPVAVWAGAKTLKHPKEHAAHTLLLAPGLLLPLALRFQDLQAHLTTLPPFHPHGMWSAAAGAHAAFGVAGLLVIALAILVGLLQRNTLLLAMPLTTLLLQKALLGFRGAADPDRLGGMLVSASLLFAYGLFRLLRGLESGVHSLNPARTRLVSLSLLILLLLLFKLWTGWQFLAAAPPQ